MKHALVIKTETIFSKEVMDHYQKLFAEQLKTGVVLIPAFFKAELLNVPTDAEVIVKSEYDYEDELPWYPKGE